jgi:hypothetical protein
MNIEASFSCPPEFLHLAADKYKLILGTLIKRVSKRAGNDSVTTSMHAIRPIFSHLRALWLPGIFGPRRKNAKREMRNAKCKKSDETVQRLTSHARESAG